MEHSGQSFLKLLEENRLKRLQRENKVRDLDFNSLYFAKFNIDAQEETVSFDIINKPVVYQNRKSVCVENNDLSIKILSKVDCDGLAHNNYNLVKSMRKIDNTFAPIVVAEPFYREQLEETCNDIIKKFNSDLYEYHLRMAKNYEDKAQEHEELAKKYK